MDHFHYDQGSLRCEALPLRDIAAQAGTPTYVYSAATITVHVDRLLGAFAPLSPLVCFSVKSCPNVNVLKLIASRGCGMDVVSGGELHRARAAGVPPEKIVYAGVGKTDEEIRDALGLLDGPHRGEPIGMFNIESEAEFANIASIARSAGSARSPHAVPRAALRVNPDVDPKTHAYTTTGKKESKFGVDLERAKEFFRRFGRESALRLSAIHLHLGSPIFSPEPYVEALRKTLALMDELAAEGYTVDTLDLGGGFAADYTTGTSPSAADYAAAIVPLLRDRVAAGLRVVLEPGRAIVANAGVLLTRVLYVKTSGPRKFVVCDAGMHTLIRPALYGSFHFIWPAEVAPMHEPPRRAERLDLPGLEPADVVGPVCESSDFLAKDRLLPPVARGDLLAVFGAGAYGMSMSMRYNSHPLPAEVLVDGDRATIIRRRETYADLLAHEAEPAPLGSG